VTTWAGTRWVSERAVSGGGGCGGWTFISSAARVKNPVADIASTWSSGVVVMSTAGAASNGGGGVAATPAWIWCTAALVSVG
jgi:hypothetical protein